MQRYREPVNDQTIQEGMMITKAKRRFVLAAVLALMALGVFLPSGGTGTVGARPVYYEKEITYYSDPGMTNIVGYGHIFCNGRGTLEGTSSPYHTEEIVNVCCGNVPC
jgi:hypothetical protein